MLQKINWDGLGITASLACAIHCAVLPLFISSLPLFGINIIENTQFEYGMIAIAFVIGSFALYHGYKKHHQKWLPLFVFAIGFIFLIAKMIWHEWSNWFLLPAVICMVSAHVLNYRFGKNDNRLSENEAT